MEYDNTPLSSLKLTILENSVTRSKIAPFKGARMASPAGVGGGKGAVIPNEILEEIFMRVDPETLSKSVPKVCR